MPFQCSKRRGKNKERSDSDGINVLSLSLGNRRLYIFRWYIVIWGYCRCFVTPWKSLIETMTNVKLFLRKRCAWRSTTTAVHCNWWYYIFVLCSDMVVVVAAVAAAVVVVWGLLFVKLLWRLIAVAVAFAVYLWWFDAQHDFFYKKFEREHLKFGLIKKTEALTFDLFKAFGGQLWRKRRML